MLLTPSHNCPWPAKVMLTPHLFVHSLPRCCAPLACLSIACQDAAPPIACLAIACQDAAHPSPVCPEPAKMLLAPRLFAHSLPRRCSPCACLPIACQGAAHPSPVCPEPAKMLLTPRLFHTARPAHPLTCLAQQGVAPPSQCGLHLARHGPAATV